MKHKREQKGNFTKPKVTPYIPKFITNTITDNITLKNGEVVNRLEDNADFDRDEVNANKK